MNCKCWWTVSVPDCKDGEPSYLNKGSYVI